MSDTTVQRFTVELERGDLVVLATDGLHDNVFPAETARLVTAVQRRGQPPAKAADALAACASTRRVPFQIHKLIVSFEVLDIELNVTVYSPFCSRCIPALTRKSPFSTFVHLPFKHNVCSFSVGAVLTQYDLFGFRRSPGRLLQHKQLQHNQCLLMWQQLTGVLVCGVGPTIGSTCRPLPWACRDSVSTTQVNLADPDITTETDAANPENFMQEASLMTSR